MSIQLTHPQAARPSPPSDRSYVPASETDHTSLTPWRVLNTREELEEYYLSSNRSVSAGVTPRLFHDILGAHYEALIDLTRLSSRVEARLQNYGACVEVRLGSGPVRGVRSALIVYLRTVWHMIMITDAIPYSGTQWLVEAQWLFEDLDIKDDVLYHPSSFEAFVQGLITHQPTVSNQSVPVLWQ